MTDLQVLLQAGGQMWRLEQSEDSESDSKGSKSGPYLWPNQNEGYGALTRGTPRSGEHEESQ